LPITPKEDSKQAVLDACQALASTLRNQSFHGDPLRVLVDTRDISGGVKKWEWVKKGVPIRIEIGPRDIETRKLCVQRRDQAVSEKRFSDKEEFIQQATDILSEIHSSLLARATAFRDANITPCNTIESFHAHWSQENPGWLYTPWAGSREQEEILSKQHKITIRCLPIASVDLPKPGENCILTGQAAASYAIWGRSY
jgi:prolyl-tRNA synthetase